MSCPLHALVARWYKSWEMRDLPTANGNRARESYFSSVTPLPTTYPLRFTLGCSPAWLPSSSAAVTAGSEVGCLID